MTDPDLLLNVPESSGPELQQAYDDLAKAELYQEQCKSGRHPQWKLDLVEAGVGVMRQRVAQLEAAEMQRRASL